MGKRRPTAAVQSRGPGRAVPGGGWGARRETNERTRRRTRTGGAVREELHLFLRARSSFRCDFIGRAVRTLRAGWRRRSDRGDVGLGGDRRGRRPDPALSTAYQR